MEGTIMSDDKPMKTNDELYEIIIKMDGKLDTKFAVQSVFNKINIFVGVTVAGLVVAYIESTFGK